MKSFSIDPCCGVGNIHARQRGAIGEKPCADIGNGVAELDALQCGAFEKNSRSQFGYGIRQGDALKAFAITESAVFNGGDRFGNGDAFQRLAICECIFADTDQGIGQIYVIQLGTILKYTNGNMRKTIRKLDLKERIAMPEHVFPYVCLRAEKLCGV